MVQSNFVENIYRFDERLVQQDVILNSGIMPGIDTSPSFASKYISIAEIKIGAGYTIRLEHEHKSLYKDDVECEQHTRPEGVIFAIGEARGGFTTTRIGETISKNYGLHMSPDTSFHFYKRESCDRCSAEDD